MIKRDLRESIRKATGIGVEGAHLEHPANPEHGDYSSNIALTLKDVAAEEIVKNFPKTDYLEKIEVAPPGFVNFFLKKEWLQSQVDVIVNGLAIDTIDKTEKERVQVEFISANPTGPLHIGNARGGFAGDVLANVLAKVGYQVQREYYINDKGVQVDKLAQSVKAYRDAFVNGLAIDKVVIPANGYAGEYVRDIARKAQKACLKSLEEFRSFAISEVLENIKKTL